MNLNQYLSQLRSVLRDREEARYPLLRDLLRELPCVREAGLEVVAQPSVEELQDLVRPPGRHPQYPDLGLRTSEAEGRIYRLLVEVKTHPVTSDRLPESTLQQVRSYARDGGVCILTNGVEFQTYVGGTDTAVDSFEIQSLDRFCAGRELASPGMIFEGLNNYLRAALEAAPGISNVSTLARYLARSARAALRALESGRGYPFEDCLRSLRQQYVGLFGLTDVDLTREEERQFKAALAQFLFYARFALWALDESDREGWWYGNCLGFTAARYFYLLLSGFSRELGYENAARVANSILEHADRGAILSQFSGGTADAAIEQFYEPFLEALDPQLRRQFGVWFTPREIVDYQVSLIHAVLQKDFGLSSGVDSDEVRILDPCCGTGSYLMAVLRLMERLHASAGESATTHAAQQLGRRIWGFDILPAAVLIASLRACLRFGAEMSQVNEAILTTNSLTGWPNESGQPALPGMDATVAREHSLACRVKSDEVWVVLGNPPYAREWQTLVGPGTDLIRNWTDRLSDYGVSKHTVGDLFCRFWAVAVQHILARRERAIVSFITNNAWLTGRGFAQMRECILKEVTDVFVLNLHGNRNIGETDEEGNTCETIFQRPGLDPGIKVGTAIVTLVKRPGRSRPPQVWVRHLRGRAEQKRARLAADAERLLASSLPWPLPQGLGYVPIQPTRETYWILDEIETSGPYAEWPSVHELWPHRSLGINENRGQGAMSRSREELEERFRRYFDPSVPDDRMSAHCPELMRDYGRYNARTVRQGYLDGGTVFERSRIRRFQQRPFDFRYLYWQVEGKLLNEARPELSAWLSLRDNPLLLTTFKAAESTAWTVAAVAWDPMDQHYLQGDAYCLPLRVSNNEGKLLTSANPWRWNTPEEVLQQLEGRWGPLEHADEITEALGIRADTLPTEQQGRELVARLLFYHAVTILHARAYRTAHLSSLRYLWPRIPVPKDLETAVGSAKLGRYIAELYRDWSPVLPPLPAGIDLRHWAPGLPFEDLARNDAGPSVHGVISNVRHWSPEEGGTVAVTVSALEGEETWEVHWRQVPEPVWQTVIGGRQTLRDLLERWRKDRERFTSETAHEFTGIARRVALLARLGELASKWYHESVESALSRNELGLRGGPSFDQDAEDSEPDAEDN